MVATRLMVMAARLCGVTALLLGAAWWWGVAVPLHGHMAAGGLTVLSLWGLALLARKVAGGVALAGAAVGAVVPVLGMLQLHVHLGAGQGVLNLVHAATGVAAIALAEMLAGRVRRA